MRTIRILAGGELARVHREKTIEVPDGVGRFPEEIHLVVDDQSDDEGADVDVADPLLVPISIGGRQGRGRCGCPCDRPIPGTARCCCGSS